MRISIVIPAFNEEDRLVPTVRDYMAYCHETGRRAELIVVDDGSLDRTSAVVNALGSEFPELRLIRLAENQGKGQAVRSGVVNAQGKFVLFADADGATALSEIERLEAAIAAGADVAIGSRALADDRVKVHARLYRRVIGRIFHGIVETLTVPGVKDTQCGFKLFRGAVARVLFRELTLAGFAFDVELLELAHRRFQIAEVPVEWTHVDGSKVRPVVDAVKMLGDLLRIRFAWLRRGRPQLALPQ